MNSNRGQYNDSPLFNMKTKRGEQKKPEPQVRPQEQGWAQNPNPPEGEAHGIKRHVFLSVVLSLVLPVLFLVSLILPVSEVRWAFLAITGLSVLSMWILGAFVRSARNTLTVIYVALAAVIGLALFIQQTPDAIRANAVRNPPSAVQQDQQALLNAMPTETPEPTVDPSSLVSEAQKRLESFFDAWKRNRIQEILVYCSPSWINSTSSPENVLFQNLSGNLPIDYEAENIGGSDGSNNRVLTYRAYFQDGGETVARRLNVRMVKINDVWYVDPNSLDMVPINEEAEQQASIQNSMVINTTIAPEVTKDPDAPKIVVYYNKAGKGKYYHTSKIPECVDSQWWPLEELSYDLLNSQEYKNLLPCQKCGAPARPSVTQ